MTDAGVLDIVRRCDINKGTELLSNEAYLFNRNFRFCVQNTVKYFPVEIIVLVKDNVKVGGIYRMGENNIHWVIAPQYRGQHILSDFLKKNIINKVWTENKCLTLYDVETIADFEKKKHLAELANMSIDNIEECERRIAFYESLK